MKSINLKEFFEDDPYDDEGIYIDDSDFKIKEFNDVDELISFAKRNL